MGISRVYVLFRSKWQRKECVISSEVERSVKKQIPLSIKEISSLQSKWHVENMFRLEWHKYKMFRLKCCKISSKKPFTKERFSSLIIITSSCFIIICFCNFDWIIIKIIFNFVFIFLMSDVCFEFYNNISIWFIAITFCDNFIMIW